MHLLGLIQVQRMASEILKIKIISFRFPLVFFSNCLLISWANVTKTKAIMQQNNSLYLPFLINNNKNDTQKFNISKTLYI